MTAWDVLLKVTRPEDGKAFRGVGNRPEFREADHPRDRLGRFIETGAEVRLMGGALATVLGNAGNGRVRVQRVDDGRQYNVDKGALTVTKRPDGGTPTDKPEDNPAAITRATGKAPDDDAAGDPTDALITGTQAQLGAAAPSGPVHPVTREPLDPMDWRPASNGAGARRWFLSRDDSVPVGERSYQDSNGQLVRYASVEAAQRAADRLNAERRAQITDSDEQHPDEGTPLTPAEQRAADAAAASERAAGDARRAATDEATADGITPRMMQDAEAVIGGARVDEITGGRGLSGANDREARQIIREAEETRREQADAEPAPKPDGTQRAEGGTISRADAAAEMYGTGSPQHRRALANEERDRAARGDAGPGEDAPESGHGTDRGTALKPGRDAQYLRFETPDQLREHLRGEARLQPSRADELNALADDPSLSIPAPGDVAHVKLPDGGYRFVQARSGRDIGLPADLATNKREADRIAGEVGLMSSHDFSKPYEVSQGMPDLTAYADRVRSERKPKKPAGRSRGRGPVKIPSPLDDAPEANDPETGRARLEAIEANYRRMGGVQYTTTANGLRQALDSDNLRFSPDGGIAAYDNDGYAVAISTGTAAFLRPLDTPEPSSVDRLLDELAATGIPFGSRDALRERWGDRDRKVGDQQAVTAAWANAARSQEDDDALPAFDPNEPGSALARLGAIADRDRAIADAGDDQAAAVAAARADNIDAFFRAEVSWDSESGRFLAFREGGRNVYMDATTGDVIPVGGNRSVEDVLAQLDATDGDLSRFNPDADGGTPARPAPGGSANGLTDPGLAGTSTRTDPGPDHFILTGNGDRFETGRNLVGRANLQPGDRARIATVSKPQGEEREIVSVNDTNSIITVVGSYMGERREDQIPALQVNEIEVTQRAGAPDAGPEVVMPDGIADPAYALYAEPQQDERGTWRIGPSDSHQGTSGFQRREAAQERLDRVRAMYDEEAARRQRRFGDLSDDDRGDRLAALATRYRTTTGLGTNVRGMTDEDLRDYRDLLAAGRDDQLTDEGRRKLAEANAELARRESGQSTRDALLASHPIGSQVDAGQPGIEGTVRGTIVDYTDTGMLRVQYSNRRGEPTVGTFNPSNSTVVPDADRTDPTGDAPDVERAPDGSSDPLPTYGDVSQEEWAVDPDGEVVSRVLGEEEGDRITLMVVPQGIVGSPTNTWRWEVRGRGERQSGTHTDRAEAMRLADEALAARSSDPGREEDDARRRNTSIPEAFGSDEEMAATVGQYLGLTDAADIQRLRRVIGNGHKRANPDYAAENRLRDKIGADRFDPLIATLLPARRSGPDRTFDGKRAADALRRYQANDPSLPVHSVGQKVTVSVLAEGPQPLLPNARNPLIYRDVVGTVEEVKRSTTSSFMVVVRPDNDSDRELDMNGRPFPVVVQTFAGDAALRLVDKPADLPDDLPEGDPPPLPDRPPTVNGLKRAADLAVGDRVLVDNDAVTITGSRREADGTLVLSYTGDDEVEWDLSIDDDESLPLIGGGTTPLPPLADEGPEGSGTGAEDTGDGAMLGGNLQPGDRYRRYDGAIINVVAVRDDGDPDVVTVTTETLGVRDTFMMGRGAVLDRVNTADLPDPDPVADDQPTARPVLYTYQRKRAVALGLDNDDDPLVAQAARRVRTRQPLTAEQAQALADRIRTIAGDPQIKVQQQRALGRLAMSFDAANAQARGISAPEPSFAGSRKAEKGTLRDVTEGDQLAFTNLRGVVVGGKLVGIRSKMSGRLYEVDIEGPDGTRQTHLLNRDTATYRLPDLPDPVVIGNPPPARTGPIREHISADRVRPGDVIEFAPNGQVTLTGRVVRMEKAPNGLWVPVIERPSGESRTDPLRYARDGEPSLIRTERGEGSADQPWDAVLPDENPTEITAAGVRVGDRVSLPQAAGFPFVGVIEEIDEVTAEDDDGTANAARILTIRQDSGDTMSHHVLADHTMTRLTAADDDAAARIAKVKADRLMQRRVTAVADRLQTAIAEQIENMVGYGKMGSGNGRQAAWQELHRYDTSNGTVSQAQSVLRSLRGYRAEAPDRDEPQVREVASLLQNLYIERLGKLQNSLMQPLLDGEADHEAANRVLNQWRDNPPIERDLPAIARSLVLAQDAIDAQGGNQRVGGTGAATVPDLPEDANIGARMKAYRAALPDNLAGFDKVTVRRASYGNLDADALERGDVPSITMSTGSGEIDRAADGGPGEQTMAHLDVVLAAGRDLRQARDRKVAEKLAGADIPDAATMAAEEKRVDEERSAAYRAVNARGSALRDEMAQEEGFADWEEVARSIYSRDVAPERRSTALRLNREVYQREAADEEYQRLQAESRASGERVMELRNANRAAARRRATAEREAALEVLAEARPMGGVKLDYTTPTTRRSTGKPLTERSELVQAMRFAESNYPSDWLERIKASGRPYSLKNIGRGHYDHYGRIIALSKDPEQKVDGAGPRGRVATHELGHGMERAIPGLVAAERAFLYSRTSSGEIGSRTRQRKTRIYAGPKEVGYKDEFPEHYTGKVYDRMGRGEEYSDAFEVFTTGVESLLAGSPYLDENFTEFMLGTMALL